MSSNKPYKCKHCNETFCTDREFLEHLKSWKQVFKFFNRCPNICFYCGTDLKNPGDLLIHIKQDHNKFNCDKCGETFYLRADHQDHMVTHLPEKNTQLKIQLPGMKPGESIHMFSQRLRPTQGFYNYCHTIESRLEKFMKHNTSYKSCVILKGGSVGKGTDIKDQADFDLVLYLRGHRDITSFSGNVNGILRRLERHIKNGDINWASDTTFIGRTPYCVKFQLTYEQVNISIDLLPAVPVLKDNSCRQKRDAVYDHMKTLTPTLRDYYSACLSNLQVKFVRSLPSDVKDVIRVTKHWLKNIKKKTKSNSIKSYFCELVVIDTWQSNGSPDNINPGELLKQVILRLCACPSIRIVWPERYDFLEYSTEKDGPTVLDPANPYRDIVPSRRATEVISNHALELVENSVTKPSLWDNIVWALGYISCQSRERDERLVI